ncbi:MAG: hypothetical protein ACT4OL_10165 [Nitrospiraceae bacterium]
MPTGDFLQEAIVLAPAWIVVNRLLDIVALLPFANLPVPQCMVAIGLR